MRRKNLHVCFGYGLTETSSGVAISVDGDPLAMEVCPDDRIEIAEDGEILIKAPTCMMQGYYRDKEKTEEVLRGGALSSGDLGFLDGEGKLHVTGRKNEVIVLDDGTKIYLPEYEQRVSAVIPGRDFALVMKNGRLTLVVRGSDTEKEAILRALDPVTVLYPPNQQIKAVQLADGPLPRTATGKLMRWKLQRSADDDQ